MSEEIKNNELWCDDLHYEEQIYNGEDVFVVFENHKALFISWDENQAQEICHSENNRKRLVEENKRLREFLGSLQLDVSNEIKLEQLLSELDGE